MNSAAMSDEVATAVARADRSAAAARALGGAGLLRRGEALVDPAGSVPVRAAHVAAADLTDARTSSGVADAVAVRLRYSDAALHRSLLPDSEIARIVVELAEQLRCESLVPSTLPGVRRNLARLFERWIDDAWQTGAIETELGLHLLTVGVVIRARLTASPIPEELEDTIESTRFALSEDIGRPLRRLAGQRADQLAFGESAREIALTIAALFPDEVSTAERTNLRESGFVPVVPPGSDGDDPAAGAPGTARANAAIRRDYTVFTRAYDRTSQATALARPDQLERWRAELAAQPRPVRAERIARFAAARLARPVTAGWAGGMDEGLLDPTKVASFVTRQDASGIFRLPGTRQRTAAAVTVLLDCSGSMRRHSAATATLCDLLGEGLDLAGIPFAVLGFSTVDWHGGRAAQDWRAAGSPANPGRLGGTHHLVFAPPDVPWRLARRGLPVLLRPDLYAEGVDGEAVQWAANQVRHQEAERQVLLVLSDGGPMSTATRDAQAAAYLDRHLAAVANAVEQEGTVELCALGIDADLSAFYRRSRTVSFGETLSRETVTAALDLIAGR